MKPERIQGMIAQLDAIIARANDLEQRYAEELAAVHPDFKRSALNLVHYRALRLHDLRDLQNRLGALGMSRLGKAESHVMASVQIAKNILRGFLKPAKRIKKPHAEVSIKEGKRMLNSNAKDLLGYRSKGRRVRIMVTLPSTAATDESLVYNLLNAGMNSVRINCAHDGPEVWKQMIKNVEKARKRLRRNPHARVGA